MPRTVTTRELIEATRLTPRQADYWTRLGVLRTVGDPCPGSGNERRYLEIEVVVGFLCQQLAALGASVGDVCARVAEQVRQRPDLVDDVVFVTADGRLSSEPAPGWVCTLVDA